MKTIYIDSDFKCHVTDDGTMTAVETDAFDGKCDAFIEGYCFQPYSENGAKKYPWKPYSELDNVQREYERERMADMENALEILMGGETA